jgi:hypothetical protein
VIHIDSATNKKLKLIEGYITVKPSISLKKASIASVGDIRLNRGSDLGLTLALKDSSGVPLNLEGYVVSFFEVSSELNPISVSIIDSSIGKIRVESSWKDTWRPGKRMSFSIRWESVNINRTSPAIWVTVL